MPPFSAAPRRIGIELDDGFRQGSVHPGCVVVPAVLRSATTGGSPARR